MIAPVHVVAEAVITSVGNGNAVPGIGVATSTATSTRQHQQREFRPYQADEQTVHLGDRQGNQPFVQAGAAPISARHPGASAWCLTAAR